MSDCPQLEDLLREGPAGHAAHCPECRALLDALAHVDGTLEAAFGGICAPPGLGDAVISRIARLRRENRLTVLPEILDLIGWAAALAAAFISVPYLATIFSALMTGIG